MKKTPSWKYSGLCSYMQVWTPVSKFIYLFYFMKRHNLLSVVLHIAPHKGPCVWEACSPGNGVVPSLCSLLASRRPLPVFFRPNWRCRSSWPRVWQLASCPAPSPHQLCAQWQLTHWLCATRWAPPLSSRPHSWALHCSGLPRGLCGPLTPLSSSPLTKDLPNLLVEPPPLPFLLPLLIQDPL